MECRSLGLRKTAQNRGRQLRTEAGRQLVGSVGGTRHFGPGKQICMLSSKVTNVCCFHLLGMRGCSLEKINLAIALAFARLVFSLPATPASSPRATSTVNEQKYFYYMYKYFYSGGSSTWRAGPGRGIFFIQFLNSHGN